MPARSLSSDTADRVLSALDRFNVELPSWGFADTGTRFGKFAQDAAASSTPEKFHDAGQVHKLTGCCPTVAVHVLWDFDMDNSPEAAAKETAALAESHGVRVGSINPNVFQDPQYKLGSFCSPDAEARQMAMDHALQCIEIGKHSGSKHLSWWLADGTNYPGQDNLYARRHRLKDAMANVAEAMRKSWDGATMLIEYKPFEPAFYHTDLFDWGAAVGHAMHAGAVRHGDVSVLVDTGHHLPGCNIESIVVTLLAEGLLGGFHFNDRKYADDDLTLGSIDPYQIFRIFDQIAQYEIEHHLEPGSTGENFNAGGKDIPGIAYMVDQSHNLKPKLEAMVQTVCEAQKLFAKAHCVDRKALAAAQSKGDIVAAEGCLKAAFDTDVTEVLEAWRSKNSLPADPLAELRSSGLIEELGKQRGAGKAAAVSSYA